MKKCQIVHVPYAGLCNRISAVMSALYLADYYSNKFNVEVFWEKSAECKAYFDELFEPIKRSNFRIQRLSLNYFIYSRRLPKIIKQLYFNEVYHGTTNDTILTSGKHSRKIYVASYNKFISDEYKSNIATILKPAPHVQKQIDTLSKDLFDYCNSTDSIPIGIHIRRTDNIQSIQDSPLELFINKMKKITETKNVAFYLASDDEATKKYIIKTFNSQKIVTSIGKQINRNSLKGMEQAVVDLWMLGQCKQIIGSDHSSYSLWASRLYNADLQIVSTRTE